MLKFSGNGEFKIMLLGDPHHKYRYTEESEDSMRMIEAALDKLKPDIAIYMGDLVSGSIVVDGQRREASPREIRHQLCRLAEPMIARGIPFSTVFGNHDAEKKVSKLEMCEILREIPGCIFEKGEPQTGVGNFNIPVMSSDGSRVAFNIWMIDSGSDAPEGEGKYAYVTREQIEWYERTAARLKEENGGEPLPSVVIQHIPVPEEYSLLKESSRYNPFASSGCGCLSDKYYVVDKKRASGSIGEGPCSPDVNSGQFDSWKKTGDVVGAFFGHDHMNDLCGSVDGIILGQCRAVGFDIYGDGMRQGVRMITAHENNPRAIKTEMHYYRELVGKKCISLGAYDTLFNDKQHYIIEEGGKVLALTAFSVAASLAATKIIKHLKKN